MNVCDTSNRVSSSIILVDTPGLSSKIAEHRQVLIDFLPKADAILLVMDINAQLTRTLTDFIATMELAKRPVFLVITHCDTKTAQAIEETKQRLAQECKLPLKQVVSVSSTKGETQEFVSLLASVQLEKRVILEQVNQQRVKNITSAMIRHIDEMLAASHSDKELKDAIQAKELELRKISNTINRMVNNAQNSIEEEQTRICRQFEDTVFTRLDYIVSSKSDNYNAEAVAAINNLASINLNEFKTNVSRILMEQSQQRSNTDLDLQSIQSVDLSQLNVSGLSFNLDLNSIGHEHDGVIATGVKVVGTVAAVAAVVATAGAAAPAAGAAAAGEAAAVGEAAAGGAAALTTGEMAVGAAGVIDTVSDIGSMISNARTASRVEKAMVLAQEAGNQYQNVNNINQAIGQQTGQKKGFIEGMVGFVTDKTWGKPQRRRAIHNYIDESLMPEFRQAMTRNCGQVVAAVRSLLQSAAEVTVAEKKLALEGLVQQFENEKDAFNKRMSEIRDYKNELLTQ